ncbi:MAG: hypothetical protein IPH06_00045 [Alphaproteobacteria bacterium]|nr:hypothetical protein [Alphaproteobacteria bacterium]
MTPRPRSLVISTPPKDKPGVLQHQQETHADRISGGEALNLTYDGSGRLSTVTDEHGRSLT